jgi:SAM-dependent methyltransferase
MTEGFRDAADYDRMLQQGLKLTGDDKLFYVDGRLAFLRSLLPHDFEPQSVLDFGCGAGETTERLSRMFPTALVAGYDVEGAIISHAAARHAHTRISFTAALEAISAESVDLCYSNGAVHHVPPAERPEVFERLFSRCRPGGMIAIFENNPWNPGTRLVMRRIPFDRDASPISAGPLRRVLEGAGFRVEVARYLFVFPAFLRGLRRAERWLTRVPVGAQYVVTARRPN